MALQGFDEAYYLSAKLAALRAVYPEWSTKTTADLKAYLANVGFTPESHYNQHGYTEGLAPNAYFNHAEYKLAKAQELFNRPDSTYVSIAEALAAFEQAWTGDAYLHYLQFGAFEKINPSNAFDASSYLEDKLADLQADSDTAAEWADKEVGDLLAAFEDAGFTPLTHYIAFGEGEGLTVTEVPAGEQVDPDELDPVEGETFTLTTSANNFVGGAGNDTFDAGLVSATTPANDTLTLTDILNGGDGTDVLNVSVEGASNALGGATISNIETINVRAVTGAAASVDASAATGAKTINSAEGAGTLAVTNLATGAAVGVIGNGTVVNGAVTFAYATATDAATINLSGGTKVGTTITNSDAASNVAAATLNSTGAANTIGAIDFDGDTAASLAALTINATTGLTATLTADDFVAAGASLTVTGAGAVNVGANGIFKTVDASSNSGGLTMTLDTVTTSFKGSTGNDTITTATLAAPAANIIDGGSGTDTLVIAASADVASAALRGSYTGFEKLSNATGASVAADGFTGVTNLITSSAGGGFTGMTAAQAASIDVTADLAATATTYALTTATGTADVLGLNIASSTATTELDATNLVVTGFETVNFTVGSGSQSLYNAAGTTALTAGTDYTSLAIGTATTDLTTVTLGGAYAAKVDLSSNATKVTTVNASANTAGANIAIGGQTGTVTVTGSANRDIITMAAAGAGGLQVVNAGAGNDSITAAQAQVAVATINGGDGTDTLTVSDTGTVTINDNNFAGVTAIEKLAFGATTGLTLSVGGYANSLATANAGVLDVTAASIALTTGAVAIDATGLSASNSLKLSLTNSDATASAGSTTITMSQGADNITIAQAGAGNLDTITISGGVAALAATTAKTIDLSGVSTGGAISVTTGAGADVVKAAAIDGTYVLGAGNDTFTGGAGVDTVTGGAGVDTMTGAGGADVFIFTDVDTDIDTTAGAVTDIITDFVTTSDTLDFDTAGGAGNYVEQLTAAADLSALLTAADTALNGTVKYYFGVVGTNGYLVFDDDGIGYTNVIQLTGVTDMAFGDIV